MPADVVEPVTVSTDDTTVPCASSQEYVKVSTSPSASVANALPILSWFSSALKLGEELKTGALPSSFISVIETEIFCMTESDPSLTVTVAEYEFFVS